MAGAYNVAQLTTIAAPLVVAALCLYAHRLKIGGGFLLFWAVGHLALAVAFAAIAQAPRRPDLDALPLDWSIGMTALLFSHGTILLGVVALDRPQLGLARGMTATLLAALALTAGANLSAWFTLAVTMPTATLSLGAAGLILLFRRRSGPYLLAGLVLVSRSLTGLMFLVEAHQGGTFVIPGYMSPLTIFLNFLTGLSLLVIAVDNAWRRLGEVLETTRREKAVADAILNVAPVSILQKDRDLRVVKANRYAHDLSHRLTPGHETIIGLRSGELSPDSDPSMAEALDRQLLDDPASGPLEYENQYATVDGSRMVMLVRKAALVDGSGEAFGTISVSLDVTHLKETEDKLRELFERAERANREKSDFLANMSHELRTPLNGIGGFAEMLAAGHLGPLTDRQREYVDHILASSRTMQGLVSDVLDLSRMDAGRLELSRAPVAVGELLEELAATVAPAAERSEISVGVEADPDLGVEADRRALLQALGNLIDNAVRYNRANGRVQITARRDDHATVISIRDTGVGMTPEQIAATGDPFLRGDALKARHGGGAGLGLAVARGLIELHGGRLAIDSLAGRGTTVRVEL